MAKQFYYVNVKPEVTQKLNNIRTYTDDSFTITPNLTDCVEHTLYFLDVITPEDLSKRSSCSKYSTTFQETIDIFNKTYPDYYFSIESCDYRYLINNLPPNTATFGGLIPTVNNKEPRGHAVIFMKDANNTLYLVDRQQSIKFAEQDISKYLNKLKFGNRYFALIFATKKQINSDAMDIEGGGKTYTKYKSRKYKSHKYKSRKYKSHKYNKSGR